MSAVIRRLNHAVLYVRDARRSADFYREALGFEVVTEAAGGAAVFLRAAGGDNHHDLGLFGIGPQSASRPGVGLYHLAWEVDTIGDLVALRERLIAMGYDRCNRLLLTKHAELLGGEIHRLEELLKSMRN